MTNSTSDTSATSPPSHFARAEPSNLQWRVERDGVVVAESTGVVLVREHYNGTDLEPVPYFPPADVDQGLLEPTDHATRCPVKGDASYYSVRLDGTTLDNAVWYYPEPIEPLGAIAGHVGFYGDRFSIRSQPTETTDGS